MRGWFIPAQARPGDFALPSHVSGRSPSPFTGVMDASRLTIGEAQATSSVAAEETMWGEN
jgi:hypothetical protein